MSTVGREKTATRMRFVAPPTLNADGLKEERATIGRYEVLETLGKGAMGIVYKARDPMLDRIVAIKTISSPKGQRVRSAYLERFKREAQAAAKMQHPSIVTIFDVGVHNEAPFMVLEFLPGESLADRLDRVRLPLGSAVSIATDLASSLAFAHGQKIVHRDVKPANVLYADHNRWKLADFGIARLPDSDLTQAGIFMGTPGYAPPEAIRHGMYTVQADVFAWGAVFYEMLCGRIPYEGPDTKTTNRAVIAGKALAPSAYDSTVPDLLVDVVMRAMHPDPGVRYQDAGEAGQALQDAWERLLSENRIPASALAAKEEPHRPGLQLMHGGSAPAPHLNTDNDATVVDLRAAPSPSEVPPFQSAAPAAYDFDDSQLPPARNMALSPQPSGEISPWLWVAVGGLLIVTLVLLFLVLNA